MTYEPTVNQLLSTTVSHQPQSPDVASTSCGRPTRNPSPPPHYVLDPDAGMVTAESLLLGVIQALQIELTLLSSSASDTEIDIAAGQLEDRLALVWDAANLSSYAIRLAKHQTHRLVLGIIVRHAQVFQPMTLPNPSTKQLSRTSHATRIVELAFGVLARLTQWSYSAQLLLDDQDVRECVLRMLALSHHIPILTQVCR
jgi:hypothetical protein